MVVRDGSGPGHCCSRPCRWRFCWGPAAASGDSSGASGGGGGLDQITSGWVWYGPIQDTGWNVANEAGQSAVEDKFGDSVTVQNADNVPYTDAGRAGLRAVRDHPGANVLVDTVGYGDIFTKVCDDHPDIYCIQTAPFTKLGQNTTGLVPEAVDDRVHGRSRGRAQHQEQHGRLRARLQAALDHRRGERLHHGLPAASTRSARCKTVVTNDYYNPPKTAQAVSTLLDAGADVIRSYTDDQGYCEVVKDKGGALAIGEFWTNGEQCGDNALVSTVWDFEDYYTDQFEAIQNGDFVSKQLEFLDPKTSFKLEDWGPRRPCGRPVPGPADVRRSGLRRREPVRRPDQGQQRARFGSPPARS